MKKPTRDEMERWLLNEKRYRYHAAYTGGSASGKYPPAIAAQQNDRRLKSLRVKDEDEAKKVKAKYLKALKKMVANEG